MPAVKLTSPINSAHQLIPQEHLDQAKHNEDLARGLISMKAPFCDWAVTTCFYAALHYIYFKLAPTSIFSSHQELESEMSKKYSSTSKVWRIYKKLKNRSENARYYPHLAKQMTNDLRHVNSLLKELEEFKKELGI